jgi:hypothetical protein
MMGTKTYTFMMIQKRHISSYKKTGGIDVVVGTAHYRINAQRLWSEANHPLKFAPDCINLSHYSTDPSLKAGNKIEETHTFAGIPQKYIGSIKSVVDGKEWSMYTKPIHGWIFSLPHFVKYSVEEKGNESLFTITCEYIPGGVMKIPFIRNMVRKNMELAISKLLVIPEQKLS